MLSTAHLLVLSKSGMLKSMSRTNAKVINGYIVTCIYMEQTTSYALVFTLQLMLTLYI